MDPHQPVELLWLLPLNVALGTYHHRFRFRHLCMGFMFEFSLLEPIFDACMKYHADHIHHYYAYLYIYIYLCIDMHVHYPF